MSGHAPIKQLKIATTK